VSILYPLRPSRSSIRSSSIVRNLCVRPSWSRQSASSEYPTRKCMAASQAGPSLAN